MGLGGGLVVVVEVNGTTIDMSSFYLPNEFFLSLELRCHTEATLHHGVSPLTDANV